MAKISSLPTTLLENREEEKKWDWTWASSCGGEELFNLSVMER